MPHSLTIHMVPLAPIAPQFTEGRHLHALFLSLVRAIDPELSDQLHNQGHVRAFTISALQVGNSTRLASSTRASRVIPPGTPCWWRLCLLEDSLFQRLSPVWLSLNPLKSGPDETPWHLGPAQLVVSHILTNTGSWADFTPYDSLHTAASRQERSFEVHFHSPTNFRQGEYDSALPLPRALFHNSYRRWQEYAGIPLQPDLLEVLEQHLRPTHFDLRTASATDFRSTFIGCLGNIHYRLFGDLTEEVIHQANVLADYLYFSGAGRKTTMGMGQVTRVHPKVH
ncbi:CRISPR system precrRNA processing endoribonuclease RAMP protein Cas6 [Anthocerotibacter panamensis]|uniref:CRISPR system precrRNA processing endoribonuclease RAMP protein Cas6 n=1 Tax=Anthocerotibacter panamensis TaxID=2857077 RepID=UPI00247839E5|nr:CRISPR system precrRNA processing endoribonuclease RAMP protein Cas6 [Anthocerotibacter panamensis]